MMPVKNVEALNSIHAMPMVNARLTLSASTPPNSPQNAYDDVKVRPERIP